MHSQCYFGEYEQTTYAKGLCNAHYQRERRADHIANNSPYMRSSSQVRFFNFASKNEPIFKGTASSDAVVLALGRT